jgi:hypothetical protein
MALIDLKSDLSKFRSDFKTPTLENKVNDSKYNIDDLPKKHGNDVKKTNYKGITDTNFIYPSLLINGKRLWQPAGTTRSKPVITFPGPQNFLTDDFSAGFTLNQNQIPTLNKSLYQGISDDGNTYTYPSALGVIQPANSKFPVAKFPGPQNFLNDGAATGFTSEMYKKGQSKKTSQFLGISDDGKTYTYPSVLGPDGSNLMKPAGTNTEFPIITFPGPQNFLNDKDASGFTNNFWNARKSLPKKETQFKSYFNYANFKSNYRIADVVSTGPTGWQMGDTQLIRQLGNGSTNLIKSYDSLITKTYNWYTPTGDEGKTGNPEPHTGFYSNRKYTSFGTPYDGFLAATYNTNSPIDDVYKKYNLRDEAHNTTYMPQPFILRGIQRKGNEKIQYWGFGSRSGFDDGLIRGGAVTVADRIIADTVRIAKFMASPKGLLWIVKQIGLGLTNAKVETIGPGILARQTRIHTGVASLLSVPGTALGLHFTRHGIPFANEIASYENVIRGKNLLSLKPEGYSRLIELRGEFANGRVFSKLEKVGATIKILKTKGLGSAILSGLAGAQSVYGIGLTQIRRVVDTSTDAEKNAKRQNYNAAYSLRFQYASGLVKNSYSTKNLDGNKHDASKVEDLQATAFVGPQLPNESRNSLAEKIKKYQDANFVLGNIGEINVKTNTTPGSDRNAELSTAANREKNYKATTSSPTGINDYLTLAYSKIPKNKGDKPFRDFRNDITATTDVVANSILGTGTNKDYYNSNNLEKKYGFGNLGTVGADRSNPNNYILPGDKYTGAAAERTKLITAEGFRGDKVNAYDIGDVDKKSNVYIPGAEDFIKFYFEDGDIGSNVMVFRCTMNGFSDSFSPGWNRIDIMGRPDGAYLYTSFERSVSFNFSVNALSRAEMVPMWRKLNYLASYTMPDFSSSGTKPGGPFMRITIGSLFQQTPGFIESLTYTIPDETTWDIAEDSGTNPNAKQLPLSMDVSMTFKVIGDYRPQLKGRVYSLSPFGSSKQTGNWLNDAEPTQISKEKKAKQAKTEADKPKTK